MKKFFLTLMFVVGALFSTQAQGLPGGLEGLEEAYEDCTTVYYEFVDLAWFATGSFFPGPAIKITTKVYEECADGSRRKVGEFVVYI